MTDLVEYYTRQLSIVLELSDTQRDLVLHMFRCIEQQGVCKGLEMSIRKTNEITRQFSQPQENKHEYTRESEEARRIYDKPSNR